MKNTIENELKPCPFCGSLNVKVDSYELGEKHIYCVNCAVHVKFVNVDSKKDNINSWNTRIEYPG